MRKANLYLLCLAINVLIFFAVFVHASWMVKTEMPLLMETRALVRNLELTDLCLFTEASYTRHLSQTDLHTPFQDYPMSLEHFPSGSILSPPAMIKRSNGKVD